MFCASTSTSTQSTSESQVTDNNHRQPRKRRRTYANRKNDDFCNSEETELIHQALAKMIAMNQMPISFCSSAGFEQFMNIVKPNYKICKEEAIKKRLKSLKLSIQDIIQRDLKSANNIACTSDCWSSLSQDSYITVTAHMINDEWYPKSYTLTTHKMEESHTASNLAYQLENTFEKWEIDQKVITVVTDNAKNVLNAVQMLSNVSETNDLTCAAHTVQLAVKYGLQQDNLNLLITQCSKIVSHFKHSNLAKHALKNKQTQLGLTEHTLIQSCATRWNSVYMMLNRLYTNRCAISNVLADRTITKSAMAKKFEIVESDWMNIETLVTLLKPLQIITTVLSSEKHSPVSMVRPLMFKLIEKHLKIKENDDGISLKFKQTVIEQLTERFKLNERVISPSVISVRHVAPFFDPRYKNLEYETIEVRENILEKVKKLIDDITFQFNDNGTQMSQTDQSATKKTTSGLEFLYGQEENNINDASAQYQNYLREPLLRYDLCPLEWWKSHEKKYPLIAQIAKKYLCIPATSVSSERCFSTAGNVVTPKRSCLSTENVNLLVFLYQNRQLL